MARTTIEHQLLLTTLYFLIDICVPTTRIAFLSSWRTWQNVHHWCMVSEAVLLSFKGFWWLALMATLFLSRQPLTLARGLTCSGILTLSESGERAILMNFLPQNPISYRWSLWKHNPTNDEKGYFYASPMKFWAKPPQLGVQCKV
jgi:hypothetical protein